MHLATIDWVIVAGVMAVTLATGLLLVMRSSPTGETRGRVKTFLWGYAAVYGLMFGAGFLLYGETVVAIHWLVVAAIAGRTAYVRANNVTK